MEKSLKPREVITAFNASGAVSAAKSGFVVVIVDVIDMSTSLEAALEKGALLVLGACPDHSKAPIPVNPYEIGREAGRKAKELGAEIIVITEPRWGSVQERINNCRNVTAGIKEAGGIISDFLPNIGAEVGKMTDFTHKIVVAVSATGGVAFDGAWQIHRDVISGTIARTLLKKGRETAEMAAKRAIELAQGRNIAVVAASSNSLEDVLGANYIAQTIVDMGYLNL